MRQMRADSVPSPGLCVGREQGNAPSRALARQSGCRRPSRRGGNLVGRGGDQHAAKAIGTGAGQQRQRQIKLVLLGHASDQRQVLFFDFPAENAARMGRQASAVRAASSVPVVNVFEPMAQAALARASLAPAHSG